MSSKRTLTGLRPQAYEHPLDTKALDALQRTPGLDTLIRKVNEWGYERLLRIQLTGSYLRVTEDSYPDLQRLLRQACETLDVPSVPDLYLAAGGESNAFTAGVSKPLIVINAGAVDLLTRDELLFVLAHEVGHIKSGHVLYHQVADCLPAIAQVIGTATFRLGELAGAGLQFALLRWKRMSEFTSDRAGLLACQDANTAITTMMKLAGLPQKYYGSINTEDFIAQARTFHDMDTDKLNLVLKFVSTMGTTHPWTVMRASHLMEWIDTRGYEKVLNSPQSPALALPPGVSGFCAKCGRPQKGSGLFCPGCGTRLPQAAGDGGVMAPNA